MPILLSQSSHGRFINRAYGQRKLKWIRANSTSKASEWQLGLFDGSVIPGGREKARKQCPSYYSTLSLDMH
ncbi:hypothetical protein [Ktedonospora formicarum]|uniref:Uncharacterized protein n=1 Tax=Ktedonospora formicarum TaxID=2778364 RepID=A0A8J3MR62_9CHLR|nr:hypothetical protein [Ktedonospora formicarum]GHO43333.1 hypothetical protein KSX_14960 [Ktedonospora formicarum]